jgi:hypothetical protein
MNEHSPRKFSANIGDFKFCCTIEHTEFYLFDKVANNLALQYAKKLFGRYGNVASLREGRCIDFNFTEVAVSAMTETHIQKRLRLLHQQINWEYSIPELKHQALQERVLAVPSFFGVCPIPTKIVALADVLLE